MAEVTMSPGACHDVDTSAGGGYAASGLARRLCLAATPTFALMALWTGICSGQVHMLGMNMQHMSRLNTMALMYTLMSIFHAVPWLELISHRRPSVAVGEIGEIHAHECE